MAAKKRPAKKTPSKRRRPRKNPGMNPILLGGLGTLAGAVVGGGADIALRYTSLSPMYRGGILLGTAIAGGVGLSFVDPALGAGVGGGCGSVGTSELVLQATAPDSTDEAEAAAMGAVRAELAAVRAELSEARQYHALEQGDPKSRVVMVDEEDLAYV